MGTRSRFLGVRTIAASVREGCLCRGPLLPGGDTKSWKEGFWGDRVDLVVPPVGGVGVYYPKGMKACPEWRFLGGEVDGEDVIHTFELRVHRIEGKKSYMNIGRSGLPNSRENGRKAVKGGKVSLANRRRLQED